MRRLRLTPRRVAILLAATLGVGAGAAYAATFSVTSWHLWAGSQTLTKSTCTLTARRQTTDTYVTQASGNTAFARDATMLVRSNSGSADWTFVYFDLSSCAIPMTGGADTATLTLTVTTAPNPSRTITVTPVLTSWSNYADLERRAVALVRLGTTMTFATGTRTTRRRPRRVTADVDALIKNPSANFGWRLSDTGGGSVTTTFASSNNGTAGRIARSW